MKALLIGCGNIGALYDFYSDEVQTYAKALSRRKGWHISVYDTNAALAADVAEKYGFNLLHAIDRYTYDVVCIAVPTAFHFSYLKPALEAKVPFIFCEKPISPDAEEIARLEALYQMGSSRVIVNYIRRFQPEYIALKQVVSERKLHHVKLFYRRGLLNNATHGLDLIGFLTGVTPDLSQPIVHATENDAFPTDPTISCTLPQNEFTLELEGRTGTDMPVFEMEMILEGMKLVLTDSGDTIALSEEGKPVSVKKNALKDYMNTTVSLVDRMQVDRQINDNFMESADLNKRVLTLLNTILKNG
jgi:predicted dehydrogenase